MPRERDGETGRFTETYPPELFLEALEALDGEATTTDIADEVGCSYRTAHAKLSDLASDGSIESQEVGGAILWKLPE
jgi:Mn-dependent DtxR family transcriptional regulator